MYNGFINVTLVSPKVKVGNVEFNKNEILDILSKCTSDFVLFPELSITSYSCQDLFLYDDLRKDNDKAIIDILKNNTFKGIALIGGTFTYNEALYNVCYVIKEHSLLGIVPKYYLPNYNEFSEARWFKAGMLSKTIKEVNFNGTKVPFGNIIFKCSNSSYNLAFGVEICEDVWAPICPSNIMSLNGANVFFNLSASNEYLGKDVKRYNMVAEASRKNRGAYLYASSGSSESSTGITFSGELIAALNGEEIVYNKELTFDTKMETISIDLGYIEHLRIKDSPFKDSLDEFNKEFNIVLFDLEEKVSPRLVEKHPFMLKDNDINSVKRILDLCGYALLKRLEIVHSYNMVIGVSGGLDSTMALISICHALRLKGLEPKDYVKAIMLPYKNSSDRTKTNSFKLIKAFGIEPIIIDITNEVDELLKDIDHNKTDITYENAQVRVRTTILMEYANKVNGIMIGTSDLSEIAMGYSTYNGDSMSMYNLNASISKTMMQSIIRNYANSLDGEIKDILIDIVNTPISAELNTNQFTENEIGKYEYIDFILYRFIKRGDNKERIKSLVRDVFLIKEEEANKIVDNFFNRFYKQQYKRNASPDSIKVVGFSLDSKSEFRMPSDVER